MEAPFRQATANPAQPGHLTINVDHDAVENVNIDLEGGSLNQLQSQDIQLINTNSTMQGSELLMIPEIEAKLILFRSVVFFVASSLFCLLLIIVINYDLSPAILVETAFIYMLYFFVENIQRICLKERESSKLIEDYFSLLDSICGFILLWLLQFRTTNSYSVMMIGGVPFLINAMLYLQISKVQSHVKLLKTVLKCVCPLQTFLIVMQSSKQIDLDWLVLLGPALILMVPLILCFISFALMLTLITLYAAFKQTLHLKIKPSSQILGLLWYTLAYSLGALAFMFLFNLSNLLNKRGDIKLNNIYIFAFFIINLALILLTVTRFQSIKEFVRVYGVTEANGEEEEEFLHESKNPSKKARFETKKHKSYFTVMSPTYFVPIDGNFSFSKTEMVCEGSPKIIINRDKNSKKLSAEEENLCYVCYEKESDSIFMSCGHGGVCYSCAIALIERKNECVECRSEVQSIVKLDLKTKAIDVIQGIEISQIIRDGGIPS